jgi:type I protein arginine methyltransferase
LVNYVRNTVQNGEKPDTSKKESFADDKFLQPALEDDALLYSLDELLVDDSAPEVPAEQRLKEAEALLEATMKERDQYARALAIAMGRLEGDSKDGSQALGSYQDLRTDDAKVKLKKVLDEDDKTYWEGYSRAGIHKTMLQDEVRTEAYRDFIFNHRHLFEGKTVMDVGCGTGILSMFCASVGARHVYAVDASDIIRDARKHVEVNGFKDRISLFHGPIENLKLGNAGDDFSSGRLPEKVDIIISEWMGYALLQENMVPSVLYARDNFLVPGGLLAPSHCTLLLAPMHNMAPALKKLGIGFWNDVYGFNMSNMSTGSEHKEIYINTPRPDHLLSTPGVRFKTFNLHEMTAADVLFDADFAVTVDQSTESVDAWMVWFDTFFLTSPNISLPDTAVGTRDLKIDGVDGIAFTTGPFGKCTHWGAGHLPILRSPSQKATPLAKGDVLKGQITFGQVKNAPRDVEISIQWSVDGKDEKGNQTWAAGGSMENPPSMDSDDPEHGGL